MSHGLLTGLTHSCYAPVAGDLRRDLRRLLGEPAGTLTIVLTLALGISAPTAIASVVRGVLLRPLPFPDQERLVMLWGRAHRRAPIQPRSSVASRM